MEDGRWEMAGPVVRVQVRCWMLDVGCWMLDVSTSRFSAPNREFSHFRTLRCPAGFSLPVQASVSHATIAARVAAIGISPEAKGPQGRGAPGGPNQ
jgi:hypothetical protein